MKIRKIKKATMSRNAIIQYFGLYLLSAFVGGSTLSVFLRNAELLGGFTLVFCIGLVLWKKNYYVSRSYFFYCFLLFTSLFLTFIYTQGSLSFGTIGMLMARYILLYVIYSIDNKNFIHRFLKFAYFMALISMLFFGIGWMIGNNRMYSLAPIKLGGEIRSFVIYNIVPIHLGKNIGIFGEPGQYQIFLSVALFVVLFSGIRMSLKDKRRYGIVFVFTIISAMSTSGYLSLLGFLIAVLLNSEIKGRYKMIISVVAISFIIYILFFVDKKSMLYYGMIGKILSKNNTIDFSRGSGAARTESIENVVRLIKKDKSLLWGIGTQGVEAYGIESCASIMGTLLIFGIITWIIIYGGILICIWKTKKNTVAFLLGLYIVLVAGMSQPNILNPFLLMMSFGILLMSEQKER